MWAQVLAIALVMACGVATILIAIGSYRSFEETRSAFYDRYRFATVFSGLQAPISALFRNGSQWNVFVVQDGRLRQIEVQVGHMNDEVAEVLDGAQPGDMVVVHPADTLAEGALVEPRD